MEDAATAEISRAQVWQWRHHKSKLDDGRLIDAALIEKTIEEELAKTRDMVGADKFDGGKYAEAAAIFRKLALAEEFTEFLTLPAYDEIVAQGMRSEEHTSELQSLMRISYAVFCLPKKKYTHDYV